ncbi:MAG: FtsQ-type POTRA domain-containing protein [Oligoflexia bacterium]|nr:FtsQ-type POTRA domain-containing protein [Oligoflexia bacterium]
MRTLVAAVLGIAVLAAVATGLIKQGVGRVQKIEIEGLNSEVTQRLQSKLEFAKGSMFWNLNTRRLLGIVTSDPWVEAAELQRLLPDRLRIRAQSRVPLAVLADKKGGFEYVDEKNRIIASAPDIKAAEYPILVKSGFRENVKLREEAVELLKSLPVEGDLSRDSMGELKFDSEAGFIMTLGETGVLINLGKENLHLRLDRVRRVVQYLNQHGIDASRIDSDYSKKVLVKLKTRR